MIDQLIENFTKYCLEYPDMQIQSVFNRYMKLLTDEQIKMLTPYFMLMIKTAEASRNAEIEIQELILQSFKGEKKSNMSTTR